MGDYKRVREGDGQVLSPIVGDIHFHNIVRECTASKTEKIIREYGFYAAKYTLYGYYIYRFYRLVEKLF